jgi:hypothetical protein
MKKNSEPIGFKVREETSYGLVGVTITLSVLHLQTLKNCAEHCNHEDKDVRNTAVEDLLTFIGTITKTVPSPREVYEDLFGGEELSVDLRKMLTTEEVDAMMEHIEKAWKGQGTLYCYDDSKLLSFHKIPGKAYNGSYDSFYNNVNLIRMRFEDGFTFNQA